MKSRRVQRSPRVLVVDDDPTTLAVLAGGLDEAGFDVSRASDGAQALELAEQDPPDIILTDVMMPEMDGFELCRRVREQIAGDELPILVMTALDDMESIQQAYDAGATDFVIKPINRYSLNYRMRYMLRAADNVRALRDSRRQLAELAYNDQLTGLPNRAAFMDWLTRVSEDLEPGRRLVVASLDIDHFKRFNDTLGAKAGDRVLSELAKRLERAVLRSVGPSLDGTALVARMGGDQFAAVFAIDADVDPCQAVFPLSEVFAEPIALFENRFYLQGTIGVAVCPDHGDGPALLSRADAAVHYAKARDAGDIQLYSEAIEQATARKLRVESDIRTGLSQDEFVLFYQPKIDVRTGVARGVEALVRWQRADGTMVSPGDFIPVAEDTGLIVPLGERVLRMACRQARLWHDAGFRDMNVAVNLSARQFEDGSLPRLVERILAREGIPASLLSLEITEGVLVENPERSARILSALRDLGVSVALDDFGTGYSSLSYLKNFPLDVLKIDRAFVRDLPDDVRSAAIAQSILGLAKQLGLSVVAEGVETREQLAFFRPHELLIQGFLFSRPLPVAEFERWHAEWHAGDTAAAAAAGAA